MTNNLPRMVLIMAGGTGGHVFPALAVAECLRSSGVDVQWLGTERGIESRIVTGANIPIHYISVSGLRGKGIISMAKALLQVVTALWQSLCLVKKLQPVCVLGMGGFVSGPGGLAAWLCGRPLVIHEQNSVAGTTNRLLARLAQRVLLAYPIALGGDKARYVGNPVRADISNLAAPEQKNINNKESLNLLVLGGSLGAKPINDLMPESLQLIEKNHRPNVWHQTGSAHIETMLAHYRKMDIEVNAEAFIDDMAAAYDWADIVLCRAGALTIAELTVAGVASLLVPLPHAIDDHQTTNAKWLVDNQAGLLLLQSSLNAQKLAAIVTDLTINKQRLLAMSIAAKKLAKIDAADQVATHCMEVACG